MLLKVGVSQPLYHKANTALKIKSPAPNTILRKDASPILSAIS
jgi:hypothetical protein